MDIIIITLKLRTCHNLIGWDYSLW